MSEAWQLAYGLRAGVVGPATEGDLGREMRQQSENAVGGSALQLPGGVPGEANEGCESERKE